MQTFKIQTHSRTEFQNIDNKVQEIVTKSAVTEGAVIIFCPHTTAGITINENADPDVKTDMEKILDNAFPWTGGYRHLEGNSAAHVKSSLTGCSETVLISQGRLVLGTWQSLYFAEFDGPRTRQIQVQIVESLC